jgi:hypothetical protein
MGATVSTNLEFVLEASWSVPSSDSGDGSLESVTGVSVSSIAVAVAVAVATLVASAAQPYSAKTSAQPTSHAA